MRIYGINPVLEALRAGRVTAIRISTRADDRLTEIVGLATAQGIPVRRTNVDELNRFSHRGSHQGVVADVRDQTTLGVEDLIAGASGAALLVVLDQIEDPHNVGAILRTVDAAGADGIVRQSRHAARLDGAAAKASAGAVSHVRVADVVNIARALDALKGAGVWTVGLAGDAPKRYDEIDFTLPTAVVLGAEGSGLRRLVRERCDWLACIPMRGHVESLNVSVAAGIVLFEAIRQRNSPRP
ncbi:MAG: 23S rRNA (guanosine(2251)-2'-O)-methyltransferase RlmB [Acidobacteria bacterium]|nr:MAG: 23S rRNA (guanosine(2251)-2'-O)-methyltransferase RlmB [Acidobacteriota bacterium]PYQ86554.1 MAG: 23S rRNA (guanosine(2251)-2'-O)-methyltransferase RlmB [Acidobacteriota bacterium]PYR08116.1 MAG: 23S rRNA (guanosine(2251)-2'-O)-methyltransferase RlmB [Acidobacteriota bacterium]